MKKTNGAHLRLKDVSFKILNELVTDSGSPCLTGSDRTQATPYILSILWYVMRLGLSRPKGICNQIVNYSGGCGLLALTERICILSISLMSPIRRPFEVARTRHDEKLDVLSRDAAAISCT